MIIRTEPNEELGATEFWPVHPHPLFVEQRGEDEEMLSTYLPTTTEPLALLYWDFGPSRGQRLATPEEVVDEFLDMQKRKFTVPSLLRRPLEVWLVRLFLLSPEGILEAIRRRRLYEDLPLNHFRELGMDFFFDLSELEGTMKTVILVGNDGKNIHISTAPGLQINRLFLPGEELLAEFSQRLTRAPVFDIEVVKHVPC